MLSGCHRAMLYNYIRSQFESASRLIVSFGVLNDNLIKSLISFVKYKSRF
jgi:hypothetical protein